MSTRTILFLVACLFFGYIRPVYREAGCKAEVVAGKKLRLLIRVLTYKKCAEKSVYWIYWFQRKHEKQQNKAQKKHQPRQVWV